MNSKSSVQKKKQNGRKKSLNRQKVGATICRMKEDDAKVMWLIVVMGHNDEMGARAIFTMNTVSFCYVYCFIMFATFWIIIKVLIQFVPNTYFRI